MGVRADIQPTARQLVVRHDKTLLAGEPIDIVRPEYAALWKLELGVVGGVRTLFACINVLIPNTAGENKRPRSPKHRVCSFPSVPDLLDTVAHIVQSWT